MALDGSAFNTRPFTEKLFPSVNRFPWLRYLAELDIRLPQRLPVSQKTSTRLLQGAILSASYKGGGADWVPPRTYLRDG